MSRRHRGQENLHRVDLIVESESEIEELKYSLVSSLESETDAIAARSVVSLDAIAARGVVGLGVRFWESRGQDLIHSRSVPSSPSKVKNPLEFEEFFPQCSVSCTVVWGAKGLRGVKGQFLIFFLTNSIII